jgi:hypothetical protein
MVVSPRVCVVALCSLTALGSLAGCGGDDPSLSGTWTPTAYPVYPAFQNLVADDVNPDASVEFTDSGTWTADDGCNDPFSGRYELASDGGLEVENPSLAGVGCEGLIPWDLIFAFTDHVEVDGKTATLTDDDDITLLVLTKDD